MPYSYATEQSGQHGNASHALVREIGWDMTISAEDPADRCDSVPFVNVKVMLQIMTLRLLSHVFHFSNHQPPYYSKLQPTVLETPLNDKKKNSVPIFRYAAK